MNYQLIGLCISYVLALALIVLLARYARKKAAQNEFGKTARLAVTEALRRCDFDKRYFMNNHDGVCLTIGVESKRDDDGYWIWVKVRFSKKDINVEVEYDPDSPENIVSFAKVIRDEFVLQGKGDIKAKVYKADSQPNPTEFVLKAATEA